MRANRSVIDLAVRCRRFLAGLAIGLAIGSNASAGSIVAEGEPVATLADGRTGTVTFETVTPKRVADFVGHAPMVRAAITGRLSLPIDTAGRVPAVVILHGSSGVNPGEWVWAARMNALGYASFVVDSFTGRGIVETETDQTQLSMTADIADALFALRLLASHPAIDPARIAVMGFSRGGVAALYSTLEPFRRAVIDDSLRFAAHVAFYPGCSVSFTAARLDGAPVQMLLGGRDDYTPAAPCLAYAEGLRAKGAAVTVALYPDAYHGFDRSSVIHRVARATSARNCKGAYDLDAGRFTMASGDQMLSGAAAQAEAHRCLVTGVTLGGDPAGRAQSPPAVAAFLATAFGPPR